MIFINTRPVDENATNERRASKTVSHSSNHNMMDQRKVNMTRLVLCLLLFYLFVSIFPVFLFYPISLVSLFVPTFLLFFALCKFRTENRSDQWPCIMVAFIGIMLKIAAIIVFLMIFPSTDKKHMSAVPMNRQVKEEETMKQYRTAFFVVVLCIEIFILLIGGCLKWHLVAFEKMEHDAKQRRHTLTSNRPLISEQTSRRQSHS
ncbi:unnamed protein product [Auanema sp. JU1783]|nr:unnamed protein product [Auanema sp. JU1783]